MAKSIAILGGIYSNHVALRAAMEDIRRRGIEDVYCLGDLGAFGPHPDRTVGLLREAGVETIQGNYDNSIGNGLADCQCGYTDPRDNHFAKISYGYTFRKTSGEHKRWMKGLPTERRLTLGGRRILLCHGSPRQMNEFLWETSTPTHFLEKLCDDFEADIIVGTHTGIHWERELSGERRFVNAGVLGRPENDGTRRVWYTILREGGTEERAVPNGSEANAGEKAPSARVAQRGEVEFVPVDYDTAELVSEMARENLPKEFIQTILEGWWTTCLEVLPAKERARGRY
jgi:predicted phosphodiesterase